jgi:WD40 repeat protein
MYPEHGHNDDNIESEEVFIDESDIIQEVTVDDEDLPDAEEESDDELDDSLHRFTGHEGEVYAVACSPTDNTLVATGGGDDKAFLWRINQGDWAAHLGGHKDSVASLAFSADGQMLASGGIEEEEDGGGIIQIWDAPSGNLRHSLEGPGGPIEWVRWHPRGHLLLAGSEDKTVWMWNADSGAYLNNFIGHSASVTCGDFTPDGKTICTGSDDKTMRIWNPRSGEARVVAGHQYHTDGLTCLAISSDSNLAITGSKDGSVHVVNITTGKVVNSLPSHTDSIECVACAPSDPWAAATGSMDKKLIIWDLHYSVARHTCEHEDGVTCMTWIGESQYLATGCADGKVRIWDSRNGAHIQTFNGHSDPVLSLSVSRNREFLVSAAADHSALVFELPKFK